MEKIPDPFPGAFFPGDGLYYQAFQLWEASSGKKEEDIPEVSLRKKQENEKAMLALAGAIEGAKSKAQLKMILEDFIGKGPVFSARGKSILKDPDFLESSEEFLEKVQQYEPNFTKEDTGQALRNVWIMNLLQKAFKIPVVCTDGVFGYSMLYPYTDNFMDDTEIQKNEKHRACERLNHRLAGRGEHPRGIQEEKIFQMIEKIEDSFPRESYPGVFQSLLYIHFSQWGSLKQHRENFNGRKKSRKEEEKELLTISFHKGGASVLADGYLVKGNLCSEEKRFCFNYGVILQLTDDLQDCKEDYDNRHQTLFSMDYSREPLDEKVRRLIVFSQKVFGGSFGNGEAMEMQRFLLEHTLWLILGSVLMNPCCFSREFVGWAEARFPVSRGFLEARGEEFQGKLKNSRFLRMKEPGKL